MKNLSATELREIEALYRSGTQSMASIAKRFGITRQSLAERVKRPAVSQALAESTAAVIFSP